MITFEDVDAWDLNNLKREYHENGFVLAGKLLTDEAVDTINEKIEFFLNDKTDADAAKLAKMGNNTNEAIWQYINLWQKIDEVADILRSQTLHKILSGLCDEQEFRIYHDQLQFKPAKIGGVNCWHQDVQFWPFSEPYTEITGWIALDDVDESNGCMRMVPGSHKWGEATEHLNALKHYLPLPDNYEDNKVDVHCCLVPKGFIHFHHHLTWHGSGMNLSDKPRRALAFHIVGGKVYYQKKNTYTLKNTETHKTFSLNQEVKNQDMPIIGSNFDLWPLINARIHTKNPATKVWRKTIDIYQRNFNKRP